MKQRTDPATRLGAAPTQCLPPAPPHQWPRKFLFVDCYAHLEDLAMDGLSHNLSDQIIPADVIERNCPQRAWASIIGSRTIPVGVHNWYNYEYDMITQPARLFVSRTEHLVQDWNTVDKTGDSLFGVKVNTNTRVQKKTVLSEPALPLSISVAHCAQKFSSTNVFYWRRRTWIRCKWPCQSRTARNMSTGDSRDPGM